MVTCKKNKYSKTYYWVDQYYYKKIFIILDNVSSKNSFEKKLRFDNFTHSSSSKKISIKSNSNKIIINWKIENNNDNLISENNWNISSELDNLSEREIKEFKNKVKLSSIIEAESNLENKSILYNSSALN